MPQVTEQGCHWNGWVGFGDKTHIFRLFPGSGLPYCSMPIRVWFFENFTLSFYVPKIRPGFGQPGANANLSPFALLLLVMLRLLRRLLSGFRAFKVTLLALGGISGTAKLSVPLGAWYGKNGGF